MSKKLILSTFAGTIVCFLLGYIFYGLLFQNLYTFNENENLWFVFFGSLFFVMILSYVIVFKLNIISKRFGLKIGATIGGLFNASYNFFMYSDKTPLYDKIFVDIIIGVIIGGLTGVVIAMVNKKL